MNPKARPLFAAIREFPRLVTEHHPGAAIFRIPACPARCYPRYSALGLRPIAKSCTSPQSIRATGVVYTAFLPPESEAGGALLLAACRELMESGTAAGAQPMIEWCPPEVKAAMSVWPPPGSARALAERLKSVFDPHRVLSPGRFQGGI